MTGVAKSSNIRRVLYLAVRLPAAMTRRTDEERESTPERLVLLDALSE